MTAHDGILHEPPSRKPSLRELLQSGVIRRHALTLDIAALFAFTAIVETARDDARVPPIEAGSMLCIELRRWSTNTCTGWRNWRWRARGIRF